MLVFDSNDVQLLNDCKSNLYIASNDTHLAYLRSKYTNTTEKQIIDLKNAPEVRMTDVPTNSFDYRMIKVDLWSKENTTFEETSSLSIHTRHRNVLLTRYYSILQIIFFLATILNAFVYLRKMRTESNPGEVKQIIATGLIILFFFNLPYKLDVAQSKITAFFDSFINSIMFSYIFGLSLVLSHSLTASLYISRK